MQIGICAPYDLARSGGVTNQIRGQARALRRLGHDVVVFGPASAPLPAGEVALCRSRSLTVHGTESGLGLDPFSAARVRRFLRESRFDILHVHEPLTPIFPWLVLMLGGAPAVGTFHVHREHGHRFYPKARWLLEPLMNRLSYRIAVSAAARRTVADHFPGEYDIVPNGIEVDEFRVGSSRPASFAAGARHVLYVGRLEPRKGVDVLIRAVARVAQTVQDMRLILVGDGPDRDRLVDLARQLSAPAHFVGRVPDANLRAYFQHADVVVSPALGGESFGIVLLEAMACGTPVVASDIEGYTGLLGPHGCGVLVPPGDAEVLSSAVIRVLSDDSLKRSLSAAGRAAASDYDWTALADRLAGIYEAVLGGISRPARAAAR